jgi:hypothetical protein
LIPKEVAMKIEILGTGCYNCVKLETLIDEVAEQLGATSFEIERIDDEKRVLQYMPLDEIPGLLIDGILVSTREIPPRETLVEWLSGVSVPNSK